MVPAAKAGVSVPELMARLLSVASRDNGGGCTIAVVVVVAVVAVVVVDVVVVEVEVVVVVVLDTGFTVIPLCVPVIGEYSPVRVAVTD